MIKLALKNLVSKKGKSVILFLSSMLLAFTIFSGTALSLSLVNGYNSLRQRLGADIMVIPKAAADSGSLEKIVLQSAPGYFYMDSSYFEKVNALNGIEKSTPQFFLASAKSGCCDAKLQIFGFDPQTDFVILPWIKKKVKSSIQENEIIVGNSLNAFVGDVIKLYGIDCSVKAKLDATGTSYDTSVFTTVENIKEMTKSSLAKGLNDYRGTDCDKVISSILINVDPRSGMTVKEFAESVNKKFPELTAVVTSDFTKGITDSLKGVSFLVKVFIIAMSAAVLTVMTLIFASGVYSRQKEFALLRMQGASKKYVFNLVLTEAILISAAGSLLGIFIGLGIVYMFANFIESQMGLPYLTPGFSATAVIVLLTLVFSITVSVLSSVLCARRASKTDVALSLKKRR